MPRVNLAASFILNAMSSGNGDNSPQPIEPINAFLRFGVAQARPHVFAQAMPAVAGNEIVSLVCRNRQANGQFSESGNLQRATETQIFQRYGNADQRYIAASFPPGINDIGGGVRIEIVHCAAGQVPAFSLTTGRTFSSIVFGSSSGQAAERGWDESKNSAYSINTMVQYLRIDMPTSSADVTLPNGDTLYIRCGDEVAGTSSINFDAVPSAISLNDVAVKTTRIYKAGDTDTWLGGYETLSHNGFTVHASAPQFPFNWLVMAIDGGAADL